MIRIPPPLFVPTSALKRRHQSGHKFANTYVLIICIFSSFSFQIFLLAGDCSCSLPVFTRTSYNISSIFFSSSIFDQDKCFAVMPLLNSLKVSFLYISDHFPLYSLKFENNASASSYSLQNAGKPAALTIYLYVCVAYGKSNLKDGNLNLDRDYCILYTI